MAAWGWRGSLRTSSSWPSYAYYGNVVNYKNSRKEAFTVNYDMTFSRETNQHHKNNFTKRSWYDLIYNMGYVRNINSKMIEGINDEHYNMLLVFRDVSAMVQSNPVLASTGHPGVQTDVLEMIGFQCDHRGLLCKGGQHYIPLHRGRGGQVFGGHDHAAGAALFAGKETKRVDYDCHICKDVT